MARRTTKAQVKLEDDDLFKEIGGQLGGETFDYSQWQRTGNRTPSKAVPSDKISGATQDVGTVGKAPPPRKTVQSADAKRPETRLTSLSSGGTALESLRRIGSASTICKHGAAGKPVVNSAAELKRQKKLETIKVLQLRIRARKQTLNGYKKRYHELLEINMNLKDSIKSGEEESHDGVKKLLRKYDKFRGGIATLNEKFVQDMDKVRSDLEKTKFKTEVDLASLQQQVDNVDAKIKEKQKELNILMNYKDKEYPLKSLRISELQKEIADVKIVNEEEINELQYIVDSEMEKYRKNTSKLQKEITDKVSTNFITKMHPTWQDMAQQNLVMTKEINYHKKELEEQEGIVKNLKKEVNDLMKSPKTNLRQQLFPHFCSTTEQCTPDMDVVLDIPTQEWLPI